ncbi:hypothetical protein DFS33DRAFT_1489483 [Desarmillaria ectypa]|nr:hypothetical protein DFS33DRAFT_1489483 [Desarmillaria ectypa]
MHSAIFLTTSTTGAPGPWKNKRLGTSTSSGDTYHAMDPNLFISGSTWHLSIGRFLAGLKMIKKVFEKAFIYLLYADPARPWDFLPVLPLRRWLNVRMTMVPWIYKYRSYYYLSTSWDICCEERPAPITSVLEGQQASLVPITTKMASLLLREEGSLSWRVTTRYTRVPTW